MGGLVRVPAGYADNTVVQGLVGGLPLLVHCSLVAKVREFLVFGYVFEEPELVAETMKMGFLKAFRWLGVLLVIWISRRFCGRMRGMLLPRNIGRPLGCIAAVFTKRVLLAPCLCHIDGLLDECSAEVYGLQVVRWIHCATLWAVC